MIEAIPERPIVASMTNIPSTRTPSPPPGWYPDPSGNGQLRYWDGRTWSAHVAHAQVQPPSKSGKGPLLATSFGLFVLAFPALVFPPLGVLVWLMSVITLIVALTR
jgi:hypothetical protein